MTVTETRGAGLPRTERGRRTRAAIVEAAAALMYRQGVSGTSVDDVLAASGTGKSQMYHYFSDKSALTMAVVKRQSDTVMAAQPLIESVRTWADLDAWVAGVVAVHRAPGGPFACPLGSIAAELKNDATFRPVLQSAFRRWASPLERGLRVLKANGEIHPDRDPAQLAMMLVAALQGGMLAAKVMDDVSVLVATLDAAVAGVKSVEADSWSTGVDDGEALLDGKSAQPRRRIGSHE